MEERDFNLEERMLGWKSYTYFKYPKDIDDLDQVRKAIRLLDLIKKRTGKEYVFMHIYQSSKGVSCVPRPALYDPTNSVNTLLGKYDIHFFKDLELKLKADQQIN